jgi:hypothetical protein
LPKPPALRNAGDADDDRGHDQRDDEHLQCIDKNATDKVENGKPMNTECATFLAGKGARHDG